MNSALLVTLAVLAAVAVLALVAVLVVSLSASRRLRGELAEARAGVEELRARVDDLTRAGAPTPTVPPTDRVATGHVITGLGRHPSEADLAVPERPAVPLSAGQFASVAVGESLVRVLSFGHGVRRALSAENRNRIRFEVRQEVRRSRKQRRRDVREAKRNLRADQRTGLAEDAA
jgi:hypothetical protein